MITFRKLGQIGRLGNQLFQIASTIGIARDLGQEPIFPADWIYRPYFNIPDEMFEIDIPPNAVEATNYVPYMDFRARDYLQDVGLFLHHMDEIGELFYPSLGAALQVPSVRDDLPHIAIHVRHGDNVFDPGVSNKADYHPTPSLDYYLRCIEYFGALTPLCIFSDDIEWCKANLPPAALYGHSRGYPKENDPEYGLEMPTDWIDLFTMAQCSGFVVSVSTFGIWGALLSYTATPDFVLRPNKVYGPALDYIDDQLLFHPDWISMPCF